MVVVDGLDERFYFASLRDAHFRHAAGDFLWVAVDAGDEGVGKRVMFGAVVDGLDYNDLFGWKYVSNYNYMYGIYMRV